MKPIHQLLGCLIIFCSISSFQCDKCRQGDLLLDQTRSWFPLKGIDQLTFLDKAGNSKICKLKVIDTTETSVNSECATTYKYEYIDVSLYLNDLKSDSIHFILGSGGWLCMDAISDSKQNIVMCNVFGQTKEGIVAKSLKNYKVGDKIYKELVMTFHNPGYPNNIDSVIISNNDGIVGFNYKENKYSLK